MTKEPKIGIFTIYWEKVLQLFLCSIVMQNIVGVKVQNGCGLVDHRTLNSAIPQEWIDETSCFLLHVNTYFLLHWWVSTAVVLVNNGGFLLAPTEKVSELPFSNGFLGPGL